MFRPFRPAIVSLALLSLLTGVVYPLAVAGVAQLAFPKRAGGSLIPGKSAPLGSELIGQSFDRPEYFWGRLSATSPTPYTAFGAAPLTGSSGSNYGPLNPALTAAAQARIEALRRADPDNDLPLPVDLITASASGLDPHISPAAALYQAPRVAAARRIGEDRLRALIAEHTEGRQFGVLGEPRVNVLQLNLALDANADQRE
ncbi:MAG TPA: potassium-transporting ATPase subunit KdpC [Pirellulales bacterium]|nr:potassium-transporting ATPase subunit KdpC [Pirellulales bacterium]